jgi:hypothetical protein
MLEDFTCVRLSKSFFLRDLLYSEIATIEGMPNLPNDPALAIVAGRALCKTLLEPLQATFGRIAIRSAYRSPQVNEFGNAHYQSYARNAYARSRHIWDERDDEGCLGAMATIVSPVACRSRWRRRQLDRDGVVDPRPSALQRAAILSQALRLQHRLARATEAKNLKLRAASRRSHQVGRREPRRSSLSPLRRVSATRTNAD